MLNKVKLCPKLTGGFVIVALIAFVVGILGYVNLKEVGRVRLPSNLGLQRIYRSMNDIRVAERTLLLPDLDSEYKQLMTSKLPESWDAANDGRELYESLPHTKEEAVLWKQFVPAFNDWKTKHENVIRLELAGNLDEAKDLSTGDGSKALLKVEEKLKNLIKLNDEIADAYIKRGNAMMIIASIFGFIVAVSLGILLTRSITKPVKKMVEVANNIAIGNVSQSIDYESGDEIGILANSLRQMIGTFELMIADTDMLSKATVEGKLDTRADATKHQGNFRKIVEGFNNTLDALVGHLDSIPAPLMIIDKEFNIRYMNKAGADILGATQAQLIGQKCFSQFKTSDCNTANCACAKAMQTNQMASSSVDAHPGGKDLTIAYKAVPLKDDDGKVTGALEVIQDTTAITAMINDVNMLSDAAIEGKLDTRADATKHHGDFKKIIEGFNGTLDAIVGPLSESNRILVECADGDLTVRMTGNYRGQLADLKNSINTTIESLELALSHVDSSVSQVASASEQIASGSQSLAEATSEQASSLEEVSSSLEELSSMSKQNADNASQAKSLSQEASNSAKSGNDAMEQMSQAITKIKSSSDKTAKIIKTIDEIAFQTNLLALNAAVEAARAGEAGKGFAVVAEEVRNLAQRSASAAKDTSDLIQQATENADEGVKISGEVFKTFVKISQSIGKVNDLIAEISAAGTEQSQGMSQINIAIADMDKITQSNAANSEESASAAQQLSAQVSELRGMISKFKLNGNGHAKSDAIRLSIVPNSAIPKQKREKKALASRTNIVPKTTEFFPLDDSELEEF